jgi:hypothetical protein
LSAQKGGNKNDVRREHHVEMFAIGIAGSRIEHEARGDVAAGDERALRDRSTLMPHDAL